MNFRPLITTFLILGVLGLGSWFSFQALSQRPLKALVLRLSTGIGGKNQADSSQLEAFEVSFPLVRGDAQVQSFHIPSQFQGPLKEAILQKSEDSLASLVKSIGPWAFGVGTSAPGDNWPWYFGGGWKGLSSASSEPLVDNLPVWDRLYFCFALPVPPPPPFANAVPLEDLTTRPSIASTPTTLLAVMPPTPFPFKGEVRLEIRNGCGIKNAADWVARRAKGPGITVTGTGNADNFKYEQTLLQTSVGVPVALEEVLYRLGLTQDSVQEVASLAPPNDAVLIIGKDYRKLKERRRDRLHH